MIVHKSNDPNLNCVHKQDDKDNISIMCDVSLKVTTYSIDDDIPLTVK